MDPLLRMGMMKRDPLKEQAAARVAAMNAQTSPLPAQGGGRFGAFGRGLQRWAQNPDNWQMLAAGFSDLSDGGNQMFETARDIRQNHRQAQMDAMAQQQFGWKGEEMDQQRAQWRQADEQRRQLEALIASLPPEEQALARLDPEGFVRARVKPQYEWKDGGILNPNTGNWTPNADYWEQRRRLASVGRAAGAAQGSLEPWQPGYFDGGN